MQSMKITISCPRCTERTAKPIVELETVKEMVCPFCGYLTDFTKKHWQIALREAEQKHSMNSIRL
jgi:hypothetical protein